MTSGSTYLVAQMLYIGYKIHVVGLDDLTNLYNSSSPIAENEWNCSSGNLMWYCSWRLHGCSSISNSIVVVQVCDRGAPLVLLELLVSAGVHEQQLRGALSVCVRRGDDPAVTLLLTRLGVDHTNNALCLGSFRLGKMKATWLSALLSERKTQTPFNKKNSESVHMIWQLSYIWHTCSGAMTTFTSVWLRFLYTNFINFLQ